MRMTMFTSKSCGPCVPAKRALDRWATKDGRRIDVDYVDIESEAGEAYAERMDVRSVPTFLLFGTHLANKPLVREVGWPTNFDAMDREIHFTVPGAFEVHPARYADGMLAVRPLDSVDGYKGRASRILSDHLKARWSGRERAYIASPAKVRKLVKLHAEGRDASTVTGELDR